MINEILRDVRYALRGLLRNPGFTIVAVLTLAIGIGATTATYTAIASSLSAQIPIRDLDRVVGLWSLDRTNNRPNVVVSAADFVAWRQRQRSFEALSAQIVDGINLSGIDQPVRVTAASVSASHFAVTGVQPLIGRGFTDEESRPGSTRVAILNNRFWRNRFDSRENAVGRTILIDGRPTTIVGVLPPDDFTPDILLPLTIDAGDPSYQQRALTVTARLKPGVSIEQARAEMDTIGARLEQEEPGTHRGWGITTRPYRDEFLAQGEQIVFLLLALTAFAVLLIGCANIANILLARGTARGHELAIRAALGATRGRLMRQMLAESLALAVAGALLGVLFAYGGMGLLVSTFFSTGLPAYVADRAFIDTGLLVFTVATSILATLLFGMLPAIRYGRTRSETLAAGQRNVGRREGGRVRSALVMAEVAAAVVLLTTATLFLRTLVNLRDVEPGFDTRSLLLMEVALSGAAYGTTESAASFYDQTVERLAALPGVISAGAAERVPVEGSRFNPNRSLDIDGRPADAGQTRAVDDITVTAGYLETLGVALREGRLFTNGDGTASPLVAVISEAAATRYWGAASPIGARVRLGDEPSRDVWRTVVGVVADVRNDDIDMPPPAIVYVPSTQRIVREMTFMIRVNGDPLSHVAAARASIAAQDPDLPVYDAQSMDQLLFEDIQGAAVLSSMTTTFAMLALLLAAIGIYGTVAYTVAQRTREIAVRVAVGAQARDVLLDVFGRGLRAVAAGLGVGLAVSAAIAQGIGVVLYGVSPADPSSYLVVAAVLLATAILACLVPARRAMRLDPIAALRQD